MLEKIAGLVRNLVALIFVATLLEMLIPRGSFSRYLRLVIGLLVILLIINFMGTPANRPGEAYSYISAGSAGEEGDAEGTRGMQLYEWNRKEVLNEYRSMVAGLIEEEILRWEKWIPVSVNLVIEEDEHNPLFGSIQQAVVVIRSAAGISLPAGNSIRIDPVRIAVSSHAGQEREGMDGKRVSELESALAKQLQLPESLIEVWEINAVDISSEDAGLGWLELGEVWAHGGMGS